jgi:putative flippase GtrA
MTWKDQYDYLRHVVRLARHNPEDARFFTFCLVGAAGVPVNLLGLTILLQLFGLDVGIASVIASFVAMVHNFLWNDSVTWRIQKRPKLWRRWLQFGQFALVSMLGIAITAVFAHTFYINGWNPVAGQLVGIMLATWWSFAAMTAGPGAVWTSVLPSLSSPANAPAIHYSHEAPLGPAGGRLAPVSSALRHCCGVCLGGSLSACSCSRRVRESASRAGFASGRYVH